MMTEISEKAMQRIMAAHNAFIDTIENETAEVEPPDYRFRLRLGLFATMNADLMSSFSDPLVAQQAVHDAEKAALKSMLAADESK